VGYVSAMCVALGTLGGGQWALDNSFDFDFSGSRGIVITLIVGLGGSAGLLGGFWRPNKTA
jgi:hypothetical protein